MIGNLLFGGKASNIYVIDDGASRVKIGESGNPEKRVSTLQVGNPRLLCVVWAALLSRSNAVKIERAIHKKLRDTINHEKGEWYTLHSPVAVDIIRNELERTGVDWYPNLRYAVERNVAFS